MERFYLIVGHVSQLELLVPHGVRLVQLRIKDQPETEVRRQIARARDFCAVHGAQLVVNDYWQLAIELGCDWVHLGQEDMDDADLDAIRAAGIRLGLSTHDPDELERALAWQPDYIALGPVYPTKLKKMRWHQQGLDRVSEWKARAGDTPLVGIGGLSVERASKVLKAGADAVSMVTDITWNEDPEARVRQWLEVTK